MDKLTFLALGDSYTIGEGLPIQQSWPHQLTKMAALQGILFQTPDIIATTGWTTDELLAGIEARKASLQTSYDLVSLLIGVNNQYRAYPMAQFESEFIQLFKLAKNFSHNQIVVVSIPDYGVTPFAKEKDPKKIGEELDAYNEFQRQYCEHQNVPFFDITPHSKEHGANNVVADQLHPNAEIYKYWAKQVLLKVVEVFKVK